MAIIARTPYQIQSGHKVNSQSATRSSYLPGAKRISSAPRFISIAPCSSSIGASLIFENGDLGENEGHRTDEPFKRLSCSPSPRERSGQGLIQKLRT